MTAHFAHGYALLIGVNKSQMPGMALPVVAKDIAALQKVLTHPERCAYAEDHVRVVTGRDATRDNILAGLDWLADRIATDDSGDTTAVVYFSGHGWRDSKADPPIHYLIPYDISRTDVHSSALRADDVAHAIGKLTPRRLFVVLDCCHAGGMGVKDTRLDRFVGSAIPAASMMLEDIDASSLADATSRSPLQRGHGRAVLSSSQGPEKSYIRPDLAMSIFTYHLIEALTGHAQPQGGARDVLVSDVLSYVHRHVPAAARESQQASQNPDYRVIGNFPIALLLGGRGVVDVRPPDPLDAPYPCMARPPELFVPRHQLDDLVALLSPDADAPADPTGITAALCGAGGFGKTTLAQALCQDARVRRAYPGGVLWVTMGEQVTEAQRLARVLDLIRGWSDEEPPSFTEVSAASNELRERLAGRRVLLVVDDVRHSEDFAPFIGLGAGNATLATTRDRHTLPPRGCERVDIGAMRPDESAALLGDGLAITAPDDRGSLDALADRLGRRPLLLDVVNRVLRGLVVEAGLPVADAIADVAESLDAKGLSAFDIDDGRQRRLDDDEPTRDRSAGRASRRRRCTARRGLRAVIRTRAGPARAMFSLRPALAAAVARCGERDVPAARCVSTPSHRSLPDKTVLEIS